MVKVRETTRETPGNSGVNKMMQGNVSELRFGIL
jgi:hypothetical protein